MAFLNSQKNIIFCQINNTKMIIIAELLMLIECN